ncbi:endoribonuclease L-PSP [Ureibacillus acetophenoni]|uniref:Endoribonuclease L-PSP n=1 Tax=Ureibacillus acetophenoni TaxID=614649 RepID=A0A285UFQ3_9BACL|nr:endoribonuclease L-PSP [Ureibacillus acetophenoni]
MRAVAGSPRGHYSPAMISGNTVYISGQTSADPKTGMPVPGGIEA